MDGRSPALLAADLLDLEGGGGGISPAERFVLYEHIDGRDADIMLGEGFR